MSYHGKLYLYKESMKSLVQPMNMVELFQNVDGESSLFLHDIEAEEFGKMIAKMDFSYFQKIEPIQFIRHINKSTTEHTHHLSDAVYFFNQLNSFCISEIVSTINLASRVIKLKKIIRLGTTLLAIQDYNAAFSVLTALEHSSISRLKKTWKKIPSQSFQEFEELQKILDPSRNMLAYRTLVISDSTFPPLIPIIPLLVKDTFFMNDCNETKTPEDLYNFEKARMLGTTIFQLDQFRYMPFTDSIIEERVQLKIAKTSTTSSNKALVSKRTSDADRGAAKAALGRLSLSGHRKSVGSTMANKGTSGSGTTGSSLGDVGALGSFHHQSYWEFFLEAPISDDIKHLYNLSKIVEPPEEARSR
eukprot:Lithocolla_globosa_v1_NODE_777_length_3296_cov_7.492892.p2 type:complete len:360 gc:universal NODE_777_length_3296_cov_7.492892:719-1798(+)